MFAAVFQELGLSKNESRIYETLLREGELPVGQIAVRSRIHRRNVYDSIQRLLEKGLVFEILQKSENKYQAVDPNKLRELIQAKEQQLSLVMPQLESLYQSTPSHEAGDRGLEELSPRYFARWRGLLLHWGKGRVDGCSGDELLSAVPERSPAEKDQLLPSL